MSSPILPIIPHTELNPSDGSGLKVSPRQKFRKTERLENSAVRFLLNMQSLFRTLSFEGKKRATESFYWDWRPIRARNSATQAAAATEQTSSRSSSILSEVAALSRRHLEAIYLPFLSPSLLFERRNEITAMSIPAIILRIYFSTLLFSSPTLFIPCSAFSTLLTSAQCDNFPFSRSLPVDASFRQGKQSVGTLTLMTEI